MSTIQISPRQFAGYLLIILGLLLLAYVIFISNGLLTGTMNVVKVGEDEIKAPETAYFLGVMLQIGILAILTVASSMLVKYGISIGKTKNILKAKD